MQIIKPKYPVTCSFAGVPGANFREKAKKTIYFLYFFTAIFLIPCMIALYTDPSNLMLIGAIAAVSVIIFLMIRGFGRFFNNYIYEEIAPGQYRSVLQGDGIGKLSKEEKAKLLQYLSENEQEIAIPTPQKRMPLYVYLILLFGLFLAMLFAPVKRELVCTHIGVVSEKHTYNCYMHSGSILRDTGKVNLNSVQKAFMASQYSQDSETHRKAREYQMQFLTSNNTPLKYTDWWAKSSLTKKVYDINNLFDAGKDFTYNFGLGKTLFWVLAIGSIIFLLIVGQRSQETLNDYIVEPIFTPKRLMSILKAEGLRNIPGVRYKILENIEDKIDNGSKINTLVSTQQELNNQFVPQQGRAQKNAEVENLTKQFYDDGK